MGKDEKEETGFGFKDRAKAEETIVLLADKEVAYQRLTVRGLLGRAKRVLSLTKAEEKIKNIKEAMSVFEEWLEKYSKEDPPKNSAKSTPAVNEDEDMDKDSGKEKSPSADTVPGLGFKDKAKAEETIKLLEGRDPDYQRLAVKGLIQRAKRVLTCTKDEEKLQNMKAALEVFDSFLEEFDRLHLSRQNNSYLPLAVVVGCADLSRERPDAADECQRFVQAYRDVNGEYKRLRTVPVEEGQEGSVTWDIVRNKALNELKEKHKNAKLFDSEGKPTKEHLEMILWAYSPDEHKTKKLSFSNKNEKEDKKRDEKKEDEKEEKKEDGHRGEKREERKREERREDKKRDEKIEERKREEKEKSKKRKSSSGHRNSSSDSSEESPKKKRKD